MKLQFKPAEKSRTGLVRVKIKNFDGVLKLKKWNYRTKRWSAWAVYEA